LYSEQVVLTVADLFTQQIRENKHTHSKVFASVTVLLPDASVYCASFQNETVSYAHRYSVLGDKRRPTKGAEYFSQPAN